MKIAQISPIIERVPPAKYGGTERVVHYLTEELVRRGHDVTLFASGDSITTAKLDAVYPRSLREVKIRELYGLNSLTMLNIGNAYAKAGDFDLIHDHTGQFALPTANICNKPVLFTMHGPFTPEVRRVFNVLSKPRVATISNGQARYAPGINVIGTVYHGMDMEGYPFSADHDNYLLYVGRISMEKGVHHAIEAALYLNMPLIIAAKLDTEDLPYFKEYVGPYLSENIKWIGEVDEEKRNELMSRALCFLHPVFFNEPFGLTLIESMACGCPVVAFDKGSIPEIVEDGKTGFVVNNVVEMIQAVSQIGDIDRAYCRKYVLEKFNVKQMVDKYEEIYERILKEEKEKTAS